MAFMTLNKIPQSWSSDRVHSTVARVCATAEQNLIEISMTENGHPYENPVAESLEF